MRTEKLDVIPSEYRELLREYCSALQKHFGERLASVCIFGSVASGKATPESDIDALVVVDGLSLDVGSRIKETSDLHAQLRRTEGYKHLRKLRRSALISEILLTPSEIERHPPILLDLIDEGVILYDRGDILERALDSLRRRLEELGARKVKTKKGHYWVLKPDIKPGEVAEI